MSPCYNNITNMSDSESDYESTQDEYSDVDFTDNEDLGDRDQDYKLSIADAYQEEISEDEQNTIQYLKSLLQNPDDMKFISPARKMPSIDEMNICYSCFIRDEQLNTKKALSVIVLERWWLKCLKIKSENKSKNILLSRQKTLKEWKSNRGLRQVGISQLGPLIKFSDEYDKMISIIKMEEIKNKLDNDRILDINTRAKYASDLIIREKNNRLKGIARAIKKIGMNKNTDYHKNFRSQSVELKSTIPKEKKEAGTGKRAMRKVNTLKKKIEEDIIRKRVPEFQVEKIIEEEIEELNDDEKLEMEEEEKEAFEIQSTIVKSLADKELREKIFL
jgi:hypothetical protein